MERPVRSVCHISLFSQSHLSGCRVFVSLRFGKYADGFEHAN